MPRPMGPRGRVAEKSKDFKGSMKRLLGSLKKWHLLLGISLSLAMISAIIALIAPNKLSDLTDTITKGISPKTEKLEEIGKKITANISNQNKIATKIPEIMTSNEISNEDKQQFKEAMTKISSEENKENIMSLIPEDIMIMLLDDIEVDGIKITGKDQLKCLKILKSFKDEKDSDKILSSLDKLPKSVYKVM